MHKAARGCVVVIMLRRLLQELLPVSIQLCDLYVSPSQLANATAAHPWSAVMAVLVVSSE